MAQAANCHESTTSSHHSQQMAVAETDAPRSAKDPGVTHQRDSNHANSFGPNAPLRYLLFPAHANITAIELLTFLPNSIHCADFVHRFFTNGGSFPLLCTIVNQQRSLLSEWGKHGGRQSMYDAMKRAGNKGWGVKSHATLHEQSSETWDEASLDVGGYKTPGQLCKKQRIVENVPFRDLALDVKQLPHGDDALDLTRMVQYCVQHPLEPWLYPDDWDALLGLLGGPGEIRPEHTDREAFKRRTQIKSSQGHNLQSSTLVEAHEMNEGLKKRKADGSASTAEQKRRLQAVTPSTTALTTSGTPMPRTQKKRKRRGPNKAAEIKEDAKKEDSDGEKEERQEQEYVRSDEYVSPPVDAILPLPAAFAEAIHPESEALNITFLREGQVGEDDPYSAYAFGGPRYTPPFRRLYLIQQPDPADNSGWAENLRWAFVQNTLYRHPYRPDAWNESPEHMEQIVKIRRELCWMSDEYQEQLDEDASD
ncbi:hypothetical protein PTNB73_01646 [Pyrenophora teres f. teres]|uniref:Uncharacterized protein n=1 Tax=Pyrenophora teres f. teres TaxID=97479 RepID=A0A6S6VYI3_9PLEO|nr:hypothetical protein HRS9139_00234 [Pyrenophora teres f. teres]KAE8847805.1 hypothetical protein PTNB85_01648 [Pyrenophora teres f. teres]KAE8854038.1 hypothetical protein HRS9122_01030 [Pyrenophora teres f. teres]KAE8867732.1 hypothetical protein PTNB29_01643 [Pyrenophora teres f. teres]KAE8872495.1 hypothetical protein PTNB73_01646 [Pyrenophora teres f. teres]